MHPAKVRLPAPTRMSSGQSARSLGRASLEEHVASVHATQRNYSRKLHVTHRSANLRRHPGLRARHYCRPHPVTHPSRPTPEKEQSGSLRCPYSQEGGFQTPPQLAGRSHLAGGKWRTRATPGRVGRSRRRSQFPKNSR